MEKIKNELSALGIGTMVDGSYKVFSITTIGMKGVGKSSISNTISGCVFPSGTSDSILPYSISPNQTKIVSKTRKRTETIAIHKSAGLEFENLDDLSDHILSFRGSFTKGSCERDPQEVKIEYPISECCEVSITDLPGITFGSYETFDFMKYSYILAQYSGEYEKKSPRSNS